MKNLWVQMRLPNTSGVFFKLLSSFMILILLPIIIFGCLAYFLFSSALQEEVKKNNDLVLKHSYVNIEQKMEEIRQTMYQTSLAVDVDPSNQAKLLDVSKTLNRIKGTQSFIDDVYVYYNDTDWVITDAGLFYSDYFFDRVYKPVHSDWKGLVQKLRDRNNFQDLGTDKLMDASGTGKQYVVVISSFPLYNSGTKGTIVVLIDENKFFSIANSLHASDGQSQTVFFILNDRLQTIVTSDPDSMNSLLSEQQVQEYLNDTGSEIGSSRFRFDDYFVSQFDSSVLNWKYVTFSSAKHIFMPVVFLRNMMFVTSLFLLALGIMLSIFLARNLYKPIGEIVKSFHFDSAAGRKTTKKISELEMISNHIQYVTERNHQLMQKETERTSLVKDYYAKTVILGIPEEPVKLGADTSAGFKHPFYSVVVIMIEMTDPVSTTFQEMNVNSSMIEAFHQILNEDERISCMVTTIGRNQLSILANYDREELLMVKLKAAMERLPLNIGCSAAMGIGTRCDNLSSVNRSYEEALEALLYRELDKNIQLIPHHDINFMKKFVDYPIEWEQQIIGKVLSGDYVKVEQLLNDMIDRNKQAGNTYKLLNDLYHALMATVNKIIQRINVNTEKTFDEAVMSIYMNKEMTSMENMKDSVFGVYRYMIETLYGMKESKNDILKEQLFQYIGTHYSGDISLTTIADHFQLNAKYISRYFKDQTGTNFIHYVNQVRIEHAKRLLLDEKYLHIDEIGERVGYVNKNTFIATFKKMEGLTPGKFRELSSP